MRVRSAGCRPTPVRRTALRRRELSCLIAAVLASGAAGEYAAAREVPFAEPPPITTDADVAFSVFAADVDGDGDLDALSASVSDNKIAWYENTAGDGSAWALHTIATDATEALSVFAADIDGDGDLDAVGAADPSVGITWYENDGTGGTWTPHLISSTVDSVFSMVPSDLDQDGDIDIVAADRDADDLLWYENDGTGATWTTHTISGVIDGPYSVHATDVDGDGEIDVFAAAVETPLIAWYENTAGDGTSWTLHTVFVPSFYQNSVFGADVDGDGDMDALAVHTPDISWFENDGSGGGWTQHTIGSANLPQQIFGGDVDHDGDIDAVTIVNNSDSIIWHENGNSGTSWTLHTISTDIDSPRSVFGADLDGDGDLDALTASRFDDKIAWFRNDTIHRSAVLPDESVVSTDAYGAESVFAADVDGDGDLDSLSASVFDDKIAWYENEDGAGGSWTIHTISASASDARSVFATDVDGDGDLDALSASSGDSKIAWYENEDGTGGSWTLHTISVGAFSAQSVFAADLDDDGDFDALSASSVDNKIAWYENDGAGGGWALHTISTTADGALSVFAADVDGDGDLDALSASGDDNKIAWYENDGTGGGWALHTISEAAEDAQSVFAADVDGDGDFDALSASRYDNKIAWYENDGAGGGWTLHTISTSAIDAQSVFAADVDGDGDLDALSASSYDSKIAWYENTSGDGSTWTIHTASTTAYGAQAVYATDIDGDGNLDVLSASLFDDKIAWYENRGGQFGLPTLNTAQKIVNNASTHDLLDIEAVHRGRIDDSDAELVTLELKLTDGTGTDLTSIEADNLIEELRIYLDDGSGTFDGSPTDAVVHTISSFSLSAGVETITFTDGNANAQLPFGSPKVYFAVADLTADADSQTPSAFQLTHLTESSSTGEDAAADIPLILEFWPDTGTGVVDTALSTASCQAPFDLQLADRTVNDTLTCEAGTLLSAENFDLTGSADVTFRSGDTVTLLPGFSVQAGQFAVQIDPGLKP